MFDINSKVIARACLSVCAVLGMIPAQTSMAQGPEREAAPGRMRIVKDLVYAEREGVPEDLLSLDVYQPSDAEEPMPILVFVHGGGWSAGDKSRAHAKPEWCVRNGWVFVTVNYRLSPDVIHPEHARDVAAAIAWVRAHAEDFGGDADRIALMGHSAGAQLAAIVASDESLLGEVGMSTDQLAGVVLLDGAGYDVPGRIQSTRNNGMYVQAFGDDPEVWQAASPTLQAREGDRLAPLLSVYAGDRKVSKVQSAGLVEAWGATGAPASVYSAPSKSHAGINRELGKRGDVDTEAVEKFLFSVFEPAAEPRIEGEAIDEDS